MSRAGQRSRSQHLFLRSGNQLPFPCSQSLTVHVGANPGTTRHRNMVGLGAWEFTLQRASVSCWDWTVGGCDCGQWVSQGAVTFCLSECLSFVLNAEPTCTNREILCSNLISGILRRAADLVALDTCYFIPKTTELLSWGCICSVCPSSLHPLVWGSGPCHQTEPGKVKRIQEPCLICSRPGSCPGM